MKQKYLKIENESSFIKDTTNGALINTNNQALLAYKKQKKSSNSLKNDVEQLKKDITEIKDLLVKIIDK